MYVAMEMNLVGCGGCKGKHVTTDVKSGNLGGS